MAIESIVIESAERYIQALNKKVPVKSAWLFGSYVRGQETPESDLDIAVVSEAFDVNAFLSRRAANRIFFEFDSPFDMEVHCFGIHQFNADDALVGEIMKIGIPLQIH